MCKIKRQIRGATLVEYSMLVALISVAAMIGMRSMGYNASCVFSKAGYILLNAELPPEDFCGVDESCPPPLPCG